jgi:hypothetical protein
MSALNSLRSWWGEVQLPHPAAKATKEEAPKPEGGEAEAPNGEGHDQMRHQVEYLKPALAKARQRIRDLEARVHELEARMKQRPGGLGRAMNEEKRQ